MSNAKYLDPEAFPSKSHNSTDAQACFFQKQCFSRRDLCHLGFVCLGDTIMVPAETTASVLSVRLYFKKEKQCFISLMTSAHNMSRVCTAWESEVVQRVSMGAWEGLQSEVARYR